MNDQKHSKIDRQTDTLSSTDELLGTTYVSIGSSTATVNFSQALLAARYKIVCISLDGEMRIGRTLLVRPSTKLTFTIVDSHKLPMEVQIYRSTKRPAECKSSSITTNKLPYLMPPARD